MNDDNNNYNVNPFKVSKIVLGGSNVICSDRNMGVETKLSLLKLYVASIETCLNQLGAITKQLEYQVDQDRRIPAHGNSNSKCASNMNDGMLCNVSCSGAGNNCNYVFVLLFFFFVLFCLLRFECDG